MCLVLCVRILFCGFPITTYWTHRFWEHFMTTTIDGSNLKLMSGNLEILELFLSLLRDDNSFLPDHKIIFVESINDVVYDRIFLYLESGLCWEFRQILIRFYCKTWSFVFSAALLILLYALSRGDSFQQWSVLLTSLIDSAAGRISA